MWSKLNLNIFEKHFLHFCILVNLFQPVTQVLKMNHLSVVSNSEVLSISHFLHPVYLMKGYEKARICFTQIIFLEE